MDSSRWGPPPAIGFQGVPLPRLVKRTGPPISVWFKPRRYPRRFRRPDARVLAAFRAAWLRSFRVLPFAAARPWRESAASDADSFPSRFSAALTARDRFGDGLVFRPAFSESCCALRRVSAEVVEVLGGFSCTPARRAFERPIAIACLVERAPCLPSRMCSISSRTNSPAWVEGDLPSSASGESGKLPDGGSLRLPPQICRIC